MTIERLAQVVIEAGHLSDGHISRRSVSRKSDGLQLTVFLFGFGNERVAGPIRKTNVAHDGIEMLGVNKSETAFQTFSRGDVEPPPVQQIAKDPPRVAMVFDHQNLGIRIRGIGPGGAGVEGLGRRIHFSDLTAHT